MEAKWDSQLSSTALQAIEETMQINLVENIERSPSLEDFQKDNEWMELFGKGYIFVANMSPDILETIERGGKKTLLHINCWYLEEGVSRKTATAYVYGNPSMETIKYAVAIFAKKSKNKSSNIVGSSKGRIECVLA